MVIRVSESRTVAAPFETAYERAIVVSLPELLGHRHLALPPVVRVEDQVGEWGRELGQTRTIHTSDRGSLRETLTVLDQPHRFGYRLDQVRGPMRPLVRYVDGRWTFEPDGSGTRVTWSWELTPSSPVTAPLVGLLGRMWHGYARQALVALEANLTG